MIYLVVAGVALFLLASKFHVRWLTVISILMIVVAGFIVVLESHR